MGSNSEAAWRPATTNTHIVSWVFCTWQGLGAGVVKRQHCLAILPDELARGLGVGASQPDAAAGKPPYPKTSEYLRAYIVLETLPRRFWIVGGVLNRAYRVSEEEVSAAFSARVRT